VAIAGQRIFPDRVAGGMALARALEKFTGRKDVVVLALPRGGVPVAYEVARALGAPLDVFLVRKIGVPGHEELAVGALASGGVRVLDHELIRSLGIPEAAIERTTARERAELQRRERRYRGDRPLPALRGRTVILVDDGLATGASMRAAIRAVRQQHPARVVAAAPVGAPATCTELARDADEVVCASMPEPFHAVGQWYDDFAQTTDDEVEALLRAAAVVETLKGTTS
jgi:putative phosphoribosyl transferase